MIYENKIEEIWKVCDILTFNVPQVPSQEDLS